MTKSEQVLAALRANVEGGSQSETGDWCDIYLDNASHGLSMTPTEFRACLGVLAKQGVYRVVDGYAWGSVKC